MTKLGYLSGPTIEVEEEAPAPQQSKPGLGGVFFYLTLVIAISFGGFMTWGFAARLDSAAYATGVIAVESKRKTIQHLEGGIIREIAVREGQLVKGGDVLIVLDDTQTRVNLDVIEGQLYVMQARRARLIAELEDAELINFPETLLSARGDPDVEEALINQTDLFTARRDAYRTQISLLNSKVVELEEQIGAFRAQSSAAVEQLRLIGEEIEAVSVLLEKGLETKPRLLALQRAASQLRGQRGELEGRIAQSRESIGATQLEIIDLENQRRTDIVNDLDGVQTSIADLTDRATAARDVLSRGVILAPEDGIVTDLQVTTTGGVVTPGQELLDLVPREDRLVIDARLNPDRINSVHPGLQAQVQLPSFSRRRVPLLPAQVTHVSADQLQDPQGNPYFAVKVELTEDFHAALPEFVELVPGMPANVLIALGERQAIDYILSPIMDAASLAMREQ
ncbi:MAG: HlyD family type I secretion periplasmic adaptor subunit [Alphaproteobacteria bacterium]|nr:HlyD family type I secretion periplasmic adaptor subunit [Alphaproteobacteria bacterium SS10]